MAAPSPALRLRRGFALLLSLGLGIAFTQIPVAPPANNFAPAEDVALGRAAAAALRQQMPILQDGYVDVYMKKLGQRLVEAIPAGFRQAGFAFEVAVLNQPRVTSVAFPGGPVFVSRGMIALADSEGALAGLLAHEISHVVLRHATAQVSRGERYQVGEITGRSVGSHAARIPDGIMERGAAFAVRTYFLTYDAEHEQQADLLAVHIMARAGYEPLELAAMIHSIQDRGATDGGIEWAMSHPAPRQDGTRMSRTEIIAREAATLDFDGEETPLDGIDLVHMRLEDLPLAHDREQSRRAIGRPVGTVGYGILPPEGDSRSLTAGDLLLMSVPANWQRLPSGNTVVFAPEGAFIGLQDGPAAVTHGVQVGVARSLTGNLAGDTQALLVSFGRDNPDLTWTPAFQHITVARRSGLTTAVSHVSPVTGALEYVSVSTAHLPDGSFLYVIGVAPQDDAGLYRNAFGRVVASLELLD